MSRRGICIRCKRVRNLTDGQCDSCWAPRNTTARGLGAEHQRNAKICIERQPWCTICQHTGSDRNPLTAGHIVPRARGGTSELTNLQTECRRCNSSKGKGPTLA